LAEVDERLLGKSYVFKGGSGGLSRSEEREGGAAPLKEMGLGLGFFFLSFSDVLKLPPPFVCVEG
jgi:hypothetical protein